MKLPFLEHKLPRPLSVLEHLNGSLLLCESHHKASLSWVTCGLWFSLNKFFPSRSSNPFELQRGMMMCITKKSRMGFLSFFFPV